jgi:beta-aspartyl-peptidase (threonine type)
MEKSEHVMLVGRGAELFATEQGLQIVDPAYFWTRERWMELERALQKEKAKGDRRGTQADLEKDRHYLGTVGAVALDRHGNLAAGTSTGGMTNKRYGRVGDSPIIGAGTYAENGVCAVSGTGHGEVFIRHAVAHDIVALMKYKKLTVVDAAREVIEKLPKEDGGVGGVIALDDKGNFATPFNTEGMFRGHITRDGQVEVAIYRK